MQSKKDFYTVDVAFKADRRAAESVAEQLRSDGYEPRIDEVSQRAPDDPQGGPLGYLVRTSSFATQAGADALRAELAAKGYTGLRTVYTGEDGGETTGPWVVHMLEVDPDLNDGMLAPDLATEIVPGRELLTSISVRTDALAAINGGDGGDAPTEEPKHDFTCTDASELILFTPIFGDRTEPGDGVEAVLDRSGRVTALRKDRGGPIPFDGSVLSGTGEAAEWLRAHAKPGAMVRVKTRVFGDGGPRLLRNGSPDITAYAEGFHWPENPEFYYRFGVRRNPRTLAGVTPEGNLLLVAVDGRQPGYSVGASFQESAPIMQALGTGEAVNLDGGGSTAMTIGEQLVNRTSDATGERPIGDAVVILP